MSTIVTGAAGFIGSHLAHFLADKGHQVIAVDCFLENSYSSDIKRSRAAELVGHPDICFVEADIRHELPSSVWRLKPSVIVNLAAMPGLSRSWHDFDLYSSCNFTGVHSLLQQVLREGVDHFVQISTSSVYGRWAIGTEDALTNPNSPYGVTKLAGERLVSAYGESKSLPFSILRYFSVYGPHQRPDMAFYRIIEAILGDQEVVIYGDGQQSRSNTFVGDIVEATARVIEGEACNSAINVAGPENYELLEVVHMIGELVGRDPRIRFEEERTGDQRATFGDAGQLHRTYGYQASTSLRNGLEAQVNWQIAKGRDQHDSV